MDMIMYLFGDLFPNQWFYWGFGISVPLLLIAGDQLKLATQILRGQYRSRPVPTTGEQVVITIFALVVIFVPVINFFAAVITTANVVHQLGCYSLARAMQKAVKV